MQSWDAIGEAIATATDSDFRIRDHGTVGGGCINEAAVVSDGRRRYFVKINADHSFPMFEAEAAGLSEIAATGAIRAPRPVALGTAGGHAYLVLEHLDFGRRGDPGRLGERLAALHRHTRPVHGWDRDNTIGSTPQDNTPDADWPRFWRERRLAPQLEMARGRGAGRGLVAAVEGLMEALPGLFTDYRPAPSLLHGDLWGGNWDYLDNGEPVVFDPATYYGDRETDLAMTELFGGPGPEFYAAYEAAWPLDPGYAVRKGLYNLYHLLNHYSLFGGGYAGQAQRLAERTLAELR